MRRGLRILFRASGLLAVGALVYVVITFALVWRAAGRDEARPAEAIIVLGAAQYDGVPSPVLANRLDHAAELFRADVADLIVVTGGRREGDRFTEAQAGATYLEGLGVPGNAIERESTGASTWESLASAARFLDDEYGITSVVLVSDPYHAMRVDAIAHELGLDATVSPSDGSASFGDLARETVAVAVGRVIGYDRLVRLDERVESG